MEQSLERVRKYIELVEDLKISVSAIAPAVTLSKEERNNVREKIRGILSVAEKELDVLDDELYFYPEEADTHQRRNYSDL